jgi:hypothetical protein
MVTLLAVGLAGGCAGMNGMPPPPPDVTYTFEVRAVKDGTAVVGIDVEPAPAMTGLYKGGHARIDMTGAGRKQIVWVSAELFEIKFEDLISDDRKGGGKPNPNAPMSFTAATQGADGKFRFPVSVARGGGPNTISSKYHLRMGGHTLDPVIIVDR